MTGAGQSEQSDSEPHLTRAGAAGYAAVVLAGGAARRMGGADKPALPVGGRPMVLRVLAAVADADLRIVVGPTAELPGGVRATRERPPGGGPVAAIAAGLLLLPDPRSPDLPPPGASRTDPPPRTGPPQARDPQPGLPQTPDHQPGPSQTRDPQPGPPQPGTSSVDTVALLAADLPLLTTDAVRQLRAGLSRAPAADGVVFVDDTGRAQFLCGIWRAAPLRAALTRLAAGRDGALTGTSMRALVAELAVAELAWQGTGPPPWFDCDTEDDIRRAEEWIR